MEFVNLDLIIEDFITQTGHILPIDRIERKINIECGDKEYTVLLKRKDIEEDRGKSITSISGHLKIVWHPAPELDYEWFTSDDGKQDAKDLFINIDADFTLENLLKLPGEEYLKEEFNLEETEELLLQKSVGSYKYTDIILKTGFEYDGIEVLDPDFTYSLTRMQNIINQMEGIGKLYGQDFTTA